MNTLILGDLHLVRETPAGVLDDLERLLADNRGARLVLAGDVFDLSADHPRASHARALEGALASCPRARAALGEHVERGGALWITSGNHDAALGDPGLTGALADGLGLSGEARTRLRTSPWFLREGGLHVEHGHLHDPDNATSHPLVAEARSLGVRFVEDFVAPTGAFRYLNANDGTPLRLFLSAFAWYGARGPYVVFKFFQTAFRALGESGPFFGDAPTEAERRVRVARFAAEHGVEPELVEALALLGAEPTLASFTGTFQRLYLDRVVATLALAGGLASLGLGDRGTAARALGLGALAMGASWALGYDRYGGSVPERLARGAEAVADTTGARLVVMGHAHREALGDRYANTGSFAFPRGAPGRPYLSIEGGLEAPRAVRRHLAPAA